MGHDIESVERLLELDIAMTFSVLPHLDYSSQAAEMVVAAGMEVMLHQPMEPFGAHDPGRGAIMAGATEEEVASLLESNLSAVPSVSGVNNHMGSLITSDSQIMKIFLGMLHAKRLYFLDSRTSHFSVASEVASQMPIAFFERDVFLDHEPTQEFIIESLEKAMKIARRDGEAIIIGHATVPLLPEILAEQKEMLMRQGARFYLISEMNAERIAMADN